MINPIPVRVGGIISLETPMIIIAIAKIRSAIKRIFFIVLLLIFIQNLYRFKRENRRNFYILISQQNKNEKLPALARRFSLLLLILFRNRNTVNRFTQ